MRRIIGIFVLIAFIFVAQAQNPASFSRVTSPVIKIPNSTVAPIPSDGTLYRINGHLYSAGKRIDSLVGVSSDGWIRDSVEHEMRLQNPDDLVIIPHLFCHSITNTDTIQSTLDIRSAVNSNTYSALLLDPYMYGFTLADFYKGRGAYIVSNSYNGGGIHIQIDNGAGTFGDYNFDETKFSGKNIRFDHYAANSLSTTTPSGKQFVVLDGVDFKTCAYPDPTNGNTAFGWGDYHSATIFPQIADSGKYSLYGYITRYFLETYLEANYQTKTGMSAFFAKHDTNTAGNPITYDLAATLFAGKEPANSNIQAHISNASNPHEVTKSQVGLGNVTNDLQAKAGTTITINGTSQDLSSNRTFSVGTMQSCSAAAPLYSVGSSATTMGIYKSTATADGYLSSTDFNTFNGKQNAITTGTTGQYVKGDLSLGTMNPTAVGLGNVSNNAQVTSVTGTAPVVSSGGLTPAISMAKATGSVDGYLDHGDFTTFSGKVSMVYPGAGIPVSTGSAWGSSLTGTNGQSLRWISGAPRFWPDSVGTGGLHTIDSIWHTPTGIAYASASTFTFTGGTDAVARMVKWSFIRAITAAGNVLKVGYVTAATNSSGTVTCTVVSSADLASGDKIMIAINQKTDSYTKYITVPGTCASDTGSKGMYYLNTRDTLYLLPADFAVRKAASGAGAALTINIRSNYSVLYSAAPDLTTNKTLVAQRPTTFTIPPGKEVDMIIGSSAGGTNKASDLQARLILAPTSLFRCP